MSSVMVISEGALSKVKLKSANPLFQILHAVGPDRFTEKEGQERIHAGFIRAKSPEDAYYRSQNGVCPAWDDKCQRSTSVGDVIVDTRTGAKHLVLGLGMREI
jgi:hypothetical protein